MKTQCLPKQREEGNILLITLLTCLIIGFTLASYLTLVSYQNYSTMRSLAWNSAVPIMEAGVEEALTHIHYAGITNLAANGWSFVNSEFGGTYSKRRSLDDSYYEVYILPVEPPVVFSKGSVPAPTNPSRRLAATIASLGISKEEFSRPYLTRSVQVNTSRRPKFTHAMVAKKGIDLSGNGISTDSFDSRYDTHSTGGMYDPAKGGDNGDIATTSGLIDSLNSGNAKIKGEVATGPGGSVEIGSLGSVGDSAWVESGTKGIQPGWSKDDMTVQFPDVEVPWTDSSPIGGTVGEQHYSMVLSSGMEQKKYKASSVSGSIYVRENSNVLLYVTDSLNIKGEDSIYIAPGASLTLVVGASKASIGGGGVVNPGGNALAFQYLGLPSNSSLALGGNAKFTGAIYAPQADFQLNGGGDDTYDFVGASVTSTVKMNGHFNFHYDEALADLGPDIGYMVTDWNEI